MTPQLFDQATEHDCEALASLPMPRSYNLQPNKQHNRRTSHQYSTHTSKPQTKKKKRIRKKLWTPQKFGNCTVLISLSIYSRLCSTLCLCISRMTVRNNYQESLLHFAFNDVLATYVLLLIQITSVSHSTCRTLHICPYLQFYGVHEWQRSSICFSFIASMYLYIYTQYIQVYNMILFFFFFETWMAQVDEHYSSKSCK